MISDSSRGMQSLPRNMLCPQLLTLTWGWGGLVPGSTPFQSPNHSCTLLAPELWRAGGVVSHSFSSGAEPLVQSLTWHFHCNGGTRTAQTGIGKERPSNCHCNNSSDNWEMDIRSCDSNSCFNRVQKKETNLKKKILFLCRYTGNPPIQKTWLRVSISLGSVSCYYSNISHPFLIYHW